jgi:uncharacterized protein YcfJ
MNSLRILAVAALVLPSAVAAQVGQRDDYHTYRGTNGRYYHECRHSNGTTGTIAGAAGGALIGHALGGGTVGTIAGGVGGGLLGRHLDKKHDEAQNRKNGCVPY